MISTFFNLAEQYGNIALNHVTNNWVNYTVLGGVAALTTFVYKKYFEETPPAPPNTFTFIPPDFQNLETWLNSHGIPENYFKEGEEDPTSEWDLTRARHIRSWCNPNHEKTPLCTTILTYLPPDDVTLEIELNNPTYPIPQVMQDHILSACTKASFLFCRLSPKTVA